MTTIKLRSLAVNAMSASCRDIESASIDFVMWGSSSDLTIYFHRPDAAREMAAALLDMASEIDAALTAKRQDAAE